MGVPGLGCISDLTFLEKQLKRMNERVAAPAAVAAKAETHQRRAGENVSEGRARPPGGLADVRTHAARPEVGPYRRG